jgi:nicotinate-nucleotide--dimethylbenzimidazole phosphoribosyltransferase
VDRPRDRRRRRGLDSESRCGRGRAGAGPIEVLRRTGGAELAAIAGATVEARTRSVPVLLDGFVVTAAVAPLEVAAPGALDHCLAGHRSPEPGHALLLSKLGKEPLLDLGMRLGEGSGALAALPLLRLATAAVVDVATFEEFGVER